MAITITIEAANAKELKQLMQDAAETLAGMRMEDIEDTKVSTIEKPSKPKKETKPVEAAPKQEDVEEAPEDIPAIEDLRAKAQSIEDKAAVKALINEFGAKNLTTIPEERRAEFMARLEEL